MLTHTLKKLIKWKDKEHLLFSSLWKICWSGPCHLLRWRRSGRQCAWPLSWPVSPQPCRPGNTFHRWLCRTGLGILCTELPQTWMESFWCGHRHFSGEETNEHWFIHSKEEEKRSTQTQRPIYCMFTDYINSEKLKKEMHAHYFLQLFQQGKTCIENYTSKNTEQCNEQCKSKNTKNTSTKQHTRTEQEEIGKCLKRKVTSYPHTIPPTALQNLCHSSSYPQIYPSPPPSPLPTTTPQSINKSMPFLKLHPPHPYPTSKAPPTKSMPFFKLSTHKPPFPWLLWPRYTAHLEKIKAWSCHTAFERIPLAPSKIPHSVQACNTRFLSLWRQLFCLTCLLSAHINQKDCSKFQKTNLKNLWGTFFWLHCSDCLELTAGRPEGFSLTPQLSKLT